MIHRQSIVEAGPHLIDALYDSARSVVQVQRHEDVVHRVQRLHVKNGALQVLATTVAPLLHSAK